MKIRLHFGLTSEGRFIGHLDLARNFERLLRRAHLPLTFSQGFSPKPKLAFGSALPVGVTSDAEYLDVTVEDLDLDVDWVSRLNALAPKAFVIHGLGVLEPGVPALMAVINRSAYEVHVSFDRVVPQAECDAAIQALQAQESLPLIRFHENPRKQKTIDIRPGIFSMTGRVEEGGRGAVFDLLVQAGQVGNIKAQEPLFALASQGLLPIDNIGRTHRKALYIADRDRLIKPMEIKGVKIIG